MPRTITETDALKAIIANLIDHTIGSVNGGTARAREVAEIVHVLGLSAAQAELAIDVTVEVAEHDLWSASWTKNG